MRTMPGRLRADAQPLHVRILGDDLAVELGERAASSVGLEVEHQAVGVA